MPETITVRGDGLTVDLILWRKYGIEGRALVEQTLDMNPGLSALGPIIPHGTEVILPDKPQTEPTDRVAVVTLFGEV